MKKYSIYDFNGVSREVLEDCKYKQLNNCQAWALFGNDGNIYLQSYHTIVAVITADREKKKLGYWSRTTSKQTTLFFRMY